MSDSKREALHKRNAFLAGSRDPCNRVIEFDRLVTRRKAEHIKKQHIKESRPLNEQDVQSSMVGTRLVRHALVARAALLNLSRFMWLLRSEGSRGDGGSVTERASAQYADHRLRLAQRVFATLRRLRQQRQLLVCAQFSLGCIFIFEVLCSPLGDKKDTDWSNPVMRAIVAEALVDLTGFVRESPLALQHCLLLAQTSLPGLIIGTSILVRNQKITRPDTLSAVLKCIDIFFMAIPSKEARSTARSAKQVSLVCSSILLLRFDIRTAKSLVATWKLDIARTTHHRILWHITQRARYFLQATHGTNVCARDPFLSELCDVVFQPVESQHEDDELMSPTTWYRYVRSAALNPICPSLRLHQVVSSLALLACTPRSSSCIVQAGMEVCLSSLWLGVQALFRPEIHFPRSPKFNRVKALAQSELLCAAVRTLLDHLSCSCGLPAFVGHFEFQDLALLLDPAENACLIEGQITVPKKPGIGRKSSVQVAQLDRRHPLTLKGIIAANEIFHYHIKQRLFVPCSRQFHLTIAAVVLKFATTGTLHNGESVCSAETLRFVRYLTVRNRLSCVTVMPIFGKWFVDEPQRSMNGKAVQHNSALLLSSLSALCSSWKRFDVLRPQFHIVFGKMSAFHVSRLVVASEFLTNLVSTSSAPEGSDQRCLIDARALSLSQHVMTERCRLMQNKHQ